MTTFKAPGYNYSPDTRKNPNSPVAHQPNVVYDYRATAPQYGYPYSNGYNGYHQHRPAQNYHHYSPPQSYSSSGWKPPTTTAGPLLPGIEQYAQTSQTNQANHALPTYPYHQTGAPNTSRQLPPFSYSQAQGPSPRPAYSPPAQHTPVSQAQSSSRGAAPISGMLSNTARTSKPPMYANAPPPSSSVSTAQSPLSQSEYLAYVTKYPYLKNAFLRRAKTYVSPYSPDGGFTPEWMPKLTNGNTSTTPSISAPRQPSSSSSQPAQPAQGLGPGYNGGMAPNLSIPRPMPQFQSPDAFQREMAMAPVPPSGITKWEHMMKQLAFSTGSPSPPNLPASDSPATQVPQFPPSRPSNLSYEMPKSTTPPTQYTPPVRSYTPPLPPPSEPQRPIPSPLSDVPKSPKRPEYSPISDDGKEPASRSTLPPLPQIHSGETWRYS